MPSITRLCGCLSPGKRLASVTVVTVGGLGLPLPKNGGGAMR